jgi:hypothetical protein
MKQAFFTLLLFVSTHHLIAQDKIEADRPSESIAPQTVSRNTFQLESGYKYSQQDEEDKVVQQPEVLLRFGLFEKIELRLKATQEEQTFTSENIRRTGLAPVELGAKYNFFESSSKKFSSSIVAHAGIPTLSSSDHKPEKAFHRVRLLLEGEIWDKVRLTYNAGCDWDNEQQEQNWVYTFSPQFELSKSCEAFFELYGFAKQGEKPEHIADAGLAYYLSSNTKIDFNGGVGLNSQSPEYFIAAGFSFRLKPKK